VRRLPHAAIALVLAAAAAPLSGCGDEPEPIRGEEAPAITSPGTTIPYENGGADGSGADGSEQTNDRGGIAGGRDTKEPGTDVDADKELSPPRNEQEQR
jgi:hypothetical protein